MLIAKPFFFRQFGGEDELLFLKRVPVDVILQPDEGYLFRAPRFDGAGRNQVNVAVI